MNAKKTVRLFLIAAGLYALILSDSRHALGQFTFMGDYDRQNFNQPLGYYVEPENADPTIPAGELRNSSLFTGDVYPDGSFIAGGRIVRGPFGDFWLRKFTATGAVDTSFGNGTGFVRTVFYSNGSSNNIDENSLPQVLKRQPDGKILFAGRCNSQSERLPGGGGAAFGNDVCLVRYNPDGTLDQSFGNRPVTVGFAANNAACEPNCTYTFSPGAGKFTMQTGQIDDCRTFASFGRQIYAGTNGTVYDIAVQPDGKIILAGDTEEFLSPSSECNGNTVRYVGILIRLNPNGSLDTSFGANGIAKLVGPSAEYGGIYYGPVRFGNVLVQPDGRIIAAGYDGTIQTSPGFSTGKVFVVTRWTANGQLETKRRLDNNQSGTANEIAAGALFSRDNTKLFVSGSYQDKQTIVRLNLSDLSPDADFGANGIGHIAGTNGASVGGVLIIKAIQPDGKILAVEDESFVNGSRAVRLNPDGSPDQSFGNFPYDGAFGGIYERGRLDLAMQTYVGTQPFYAAHLLLQPNGKTNLIGTANIHGGQDIYRGAVSQQYNVFKNGNYSDFTNDGKSDLSVFRNGTWYYLNSETNQLSGIGFGQTGDQIAPADYDGDGKTDPAVFRNGAWYLLQSAKGFAGINFGAAGDLPRPGDFDGDGRADVSVFRPSNGTWYCLNSSNKQFVGVAFGQAGDVPLLADFDADGKSDIAVFRQGVWYYLQSSDGAFRGVSFGAAGDVPTAADYDADGKTDVSVFRPANGTWYRLNSGNGQFVGAQFGQTGDKPVPGDYDGDGRSDLAIFRNGTWFVLRSGSNAAAGISFGAGTDTPIPNAYLP